MPCPTVPPLNLGPVGLRQKLRQNLRLGVGQVRALASHPPHCGCSLVQSLAGCLHPIEVLGPVHIGDLLVSSNVPGYAMVAEGTPAPGTVIAKALENFDGEKGLISAMILNH